MVEQWNSVRGTVFVERRNSVCGTVFWNSAGGTVEQWNSESGIVWLNNEIVMVEQCGGTVEQCVDGIVQQCWWSSGTVMVEQCRWNSDSEIGGTVKQCLWNSVVEQWNSDGGTVLVE